MPVSLMKTLVAAVALIALSGTAEAATKAQPYTYATIPFGGGGYIDGFLYHPKVKDLLYVRTDVGGAYRFDYKARRWIPLMDGFGRSDWDCFGTLSLAVDPNNAKALYATCGLYLGDRVPQAGVIASSDQGRTWRKTTLPFRLGGNALGRGTGERLQVDPKNGERIFLGTNQDGLWVSSDRAKSFARVDGYPNKGVTFVLFGDGVIYAGSGTNTSEWQGSGGGGVFVSHDDGKTFALIPGSPKLIPHQAVTDADGALYVTFADGLGPHGVTNGAVYRLDPSGAWSDITPAKPSASEPFGYSGLDIDRSRPGTLVVSTSDRYGKVHDDLYVSHDRGATWASVSENAAHNAAHYPWLKAYMGGGDKDGGARRNMGHWLDAVKINPFNGNELVYGTGYGVWMTGNLSALDRHQTVDFDFADANLEETVVLGLESPPAGPRVLMAAGDIGGTAFDDFSKSPTSGLFTPENKTNQSVAFAALKPNVVVRSVDYEKARGFISYDGAETWTPLPSAPAPIATADWEKHRAGKLSISALASAMVWVPDGEGGYYSKDGGKTWTLATGWPQMGRGEAIADPAKDSVFYAYDRKTGAIVVSDDGGATFRAYVSGLAGDGVQLRAMPGRSGDLWLAAAKGLYRVRDGKAVQIIGVDAAWAVTFGKAAKAAKTPAVFLWGKVGGIEGLWRSDNAGKGWVRINDDAHRFGQLRAIAGDPRRFGVLYLSPDGRGTMVGTARGAFRRRDVVVGFLTFLATRRP
ncbi:MAG: exo-alpha-sialidase [Asticcacaulis sp.]|nr:exo-alpha-sialidase [Asticcacaulis sp.]